VAARLLHAVHGELAYLAAELEQFFSTQQPKVARLLHTIKHAHIAILAAVFDLSRRAVVLTGATGNIGPTVLRAYIEQGAHVAIPVRDEAKGAALRESLGGLAGAPDDPRILVRAADPGDRPAMEGFVEQVLRAWGRLDVVANLIGGYASSDAATGDLAAYRGYWDQKVATIVTATTACLAPMRARGYGRVVNVASTAALKGEKGAAGYAMANAALLRWTESLAEETKREGITANCVLPRIIDNPENRAAMPKADPSRWATAAEVAAVIVFLSSDESSGITGTALPVTART
jgi:NAD(P)-dependent dehydrogenase (short-subunit alcohol dehydrogenase family)